MSDAITREYRFLTGAERFALVIAAMARKDQVEIDRLEDTCPQAHYQMDHSAFRSRMSISFSAAALTALRIAPSLAIIRSLSFLSEWSETFNFWPTRVAEMVFLYGRAYGRWEAGTTEEIDMSALEILKGKEPDKGDSALQLQLADVREVARDGAARLGKYMVDTVEALAIEALSCWEGFTRFCRDTAGVEPMVLMQGWGLIHEDPTAEIARLYPAAKPNPAQAEAWRENLASCWAGRLDIIDANDQHMR
jgi:hypothetical protein